MTDRELLVEQAASAWRPRDHHGVIRPHPAWSDLDAAGRREAFAAARRARALEAGLHAEGLSSTGAAVLRRIRGDAGR
jgi:hypothetical protein